jgi:hypothetical protein
MKVAREIESCKEFTLKEITSALDEARQKCPRACLQPEWNKMLTRIKPNIWAEIRSEIKTLRMQDYARWRNIDITTSASVTAQGTAFVHWTIRSSSNEQRPTQKYRINLLEPSSRHPGSPAEDVDQPEGLCRAETPSSTPSVVTTNTA